MPASPAISNSDEIESARGAAREAVARSKTDWRRRPAEETFSLGRYVITGRIASGGMATVYRARLEGEGGFAREFAVKVIHPHLAAAEGFRERFLDEARVASRANHPNVVATVDSDQDRGYHYLVLELVDGITLRQLQVNDLHRSTTSEGAHLSAAEAARVVCDAARGLHAVHSVADEHGESLDVVHRDLSPHNLMLDVTGRTVLIDLGLAKARGQLGHTQTGVLCGKLPYMSPEQSRVAPLDARSDVFSLGSVLFELAVGQPPFGDDHTPGTLDKLRKCDTDRLARLLVEADVPSWLTQVILGCLRRDPDDRYPSAAALADSLDESMRRAGVNESEARSSLARRAGSVRDQLGPVQPAEPLPPLISADPTGLTGPYGSVQLQGLPSWFPRLPSWVGALGMAFAGALVVLVGLSVYEALDGSRSARASEHRWIPSMASDVTSSEPTPSPAPKSAEVVTPDPALAPAPKGSSDSSGSEKPDDEEDLLEPARKQKRANTGKRDPLADFKRNPYD